MKRPHLKAYLPLLAVTAFKAAALFGSAGTLDWWQGWVLLAVDLVFSARASAHLAGDGAELREERRNAARKAKAWDRKLVPWVVAILPLALIVTAGLDRRFAWTLPLPLWVNASGATVLVLGSLIILGAFRSNRFFSSFARIQSERGHQVVSQGPYAWVRHPGYLGMSLGSLAWPLLLGSRAALPIGLLIVGLNTVRTALEDRMLLEELEGYRDYAQRVKWRLLPGIW